MSSVTSGPNRFCSAVVAWLQPDSGIARSAAVVEAQANMPRPAHPGLDVNAGFEEIDLGAIQKHESGVDQEAADIRLLGRLLRGRWLLGDKARGHKEQRGGERNQTGNGAMRVSGGLLWHLISINAGFRHWVSDSG
jgi:hypothetical protein